MNFSKINNMADFIVVTWPFKKLIRKARSFLLVYESRLIRAMRTIFTKPYYSLEGWSIIRYDRCVRNKTVWDTKCSIISIFSPSVTFLWCACNK